ncbi:MAG: hypothetical protein WA061_02685 [Microgenomates group bacterium]
MMNIEKQKLVADSVLKKIETVDPTAIIAGGAPRDWHFGNLASDIDVFFCFNREDLQPYYITDLLENGLGFKNVGRIQVDHFTDENGRDKKNENVLHVYNYLEKDVKIQFIVTKNPTWGLLETFPLNISRAWYKRGQIELTREFMWTEKHNAIVKMSDLYMNGDKYVEKIRNKFPNFNYFVNEEEFRKHIVNKYL